MMKSVSCQLHPVQCQCNRLTWNIFQCLFADVEMHDITSMHAMSLWQMSMLFLGTLAKPKGQLAGFIRNISADVAAHGLSVVIAVRSTDISHVS